MTKADLINYISEKSGITRVKAETVVNTIFDFKMSNIYFNIYYFVQFVFNSFLFLGHLFKLTVKLLYKNCHRKQHWFLGITLPTFFLPAVSIRLETAQNYKVGKNIFQACRPMLVQEHKN